MSRYNKSSYVKGSDSSESSGDESKANFKRCKRVKIDDITSTDEVDCSLSTLRRGPSEPLRSINTKNGVGSNPDTSNSASPKLPHEEVSALRNRAVTFHSTSTDIMKIMGFDRSKGLGRFMNSREIAGSKLETIHTAVQKAGITINDESLDLEEEIPIEEEVRWIPPTFPKHSCDFGTFSPWLKVGPGGPAPSTDKFINPTVFKQVTALRGCFGVMTEYEYQQVRARCNVFETVGKGPFICRAAMKIANLDAVLSFALTQPTTNSADKKPVIGQNDLFYFADVAAGPGGFSEYVLYRNKWNAKGFGITLKGKLDFDVWSFTQGSPESFECFYGPAQDGDIYNPANTTAYMQHIMSCTDGRGVHLMMADGGFHVENKELQEVVSAQIYLAQCFLALCVVRPGGTFVCKFFETLTPFTVGLIYLMYLSFELVSIHKPNTSRPANSEKYLICKWKKEDVDGMKSFLGSCHTLFWKWSQQGEAQGVKKNQILELVPLPVLQANKEFFAFIHECNTTLAQKQAAALQKLVIFSRNPEMVDKRQTSVRKRCFEYWKVPEILNVAAPLPRPDRTFSDLLGDLSGEFVDKPEYPLNEHNVEGFIRSPFDWRIVVVEAVQPDRNRGFYISLGRDRVYRYEGNSWIITTEKIELCNKTFVYGEFVDEIHGKKPNQHVVRTFHIIDAMMLGGSDVRGLHYTARHEICIKFAKSMNKTSQPHLCSIRAKNPIRLENMGDIFDRLENRVVTGHGGATQLVCPVDHTDETLPFIRPAGILFIKITKDPWTMLLSKTQNRKYYFNAATGASGYHVNEDSISDFDYTMKHRMIWWWNRELQTILATQDVTNDSKKVTTSQSILNPQFLLQYIRSAWQTNPQGIAMRRLSSSSSQSSV